MILLVNADAKRLPLKSGSVHLCVTSPPYFNLRSYGTHGEIGSEADPAEYIRNLVMVFHEVKRVLRADGTLWLNLGDSYNGSGGAGGDYNEGGLRAGQPKVGRSKWSEVKERDMMGIPWRVALALQDDGWYLRSEMIWAKHNPMPFPLLGWRWEKHRVGISSDAKEEYERLIAEEMARVGCDRAHAAKDIEAIRPDLTKECPGCDKCNINNGYILRRTAWRPTSAHEQIFLFSKSAKYYADHIAVMEPLSIESLDGKKPKFGGNKYKIGVDNPTYSGMEYSVDGREGKNMRDVVRFKQSNYSGEHFAVFPQELPEMAIKAGTSEHGVCAVCGAPWVRVLDSKRVTRPELPKDDVRYRPNVYHGAYEEINGKGDAGYAVYTEHGWRASCKCSTDQVVPAVVLDPFFGSGTTGLAARDLGRSVIGADLKYAYLHDEARVRLSLDKLAEWEKGKPASTTVMSDLPLFASLGEYD